MLNEMEELNKLVEIQRFLLQKIVKAIEDRPVAIVVDKEHGNRSLNEYDRLTPDDTYEILISFPDGTSYKFLGIKCIECPRYKADTLIVRSLSNDAVVLITRVDHVT